MTRENVLLTILCETTGRPAEAFDTALAITRTMGGGSALDEELSPDEAATLLAALRAEKPAILAWLIGDTHPGRGDRDLKAKFVQRLGYEFKARQDKRHGTSMARIKKGRMGKTTTWCFYVGEKKAGER